MISPRICGKQTIHHTIVAYLWYEKHDLCYVNFTVLVCNPMKQSAAKSVNVCEFRCDSYLCACVCFHYVLHKLGCFYWNRVRLTSWPLTSVAAIVALPSLDTANQCASNPCVNDGVCIDGDYKYTCLCIPGFRGTICEISPPQRHEPSGQCSSRLDVVFVLDSSEGVTESNFKRSQSFVNAVAREVGVSHDDVRFGLMTFATQPHLAFHLNDYVADMEGLSYAIMTTRYKPGKTNTALAIRYARNVMFQRRNGDRSDVKNMMVLITEGQSNMNRGLGPREATMARHAGITVMGVGIGPKTDGIRNIVRDDGNILLVQDYIALDGAAPDVARLLCKGNGRK